MSKIPAMAQIQEDIAGILSEWDAPDISVEKLEELEKRLAEAIENQTIKVDNIARHIRMKQAYAEACKEEAKRLQQKARSAKARLDWLRGYYLKTMAQQGIKKISGEAYSISASRRQSVEITDMAALQKSAPEFVRTKIEYSPDKLAIKAAIDAGAEVSGVRIVEKEFLMVS